MERWCVSVCQSQTVGWPICITVLSDKCPVEVSPLLCSFFCWIFITFGLSFCLEVFIIRGFFLLQVIYNNGKLRISSDSCGFAFVVLLPKMFSKIWNKEVCLLLTKRLLNRHRLVLFLTTPSGQASCSFALTQPLCYGNCPLYKQDNTGRVDLRLKITDSGEEMSPFFTYVSLFPYIRTFDCLLWLT